MINCTFWAICPTEGFFRPTSTRYWRAVRTFRAYISPSLMLVSLMTETTLVLMAAMVRVLNWKLQVGSNGHSLCSCFHQQNHTSMATIYQTWSSSLFTLESVSPSWFHHILGLILDPGNDIGQRGPCIPHKFSITIVWFQAQCRCRF